MCGNGLALSSAPTDLAKSHSHTSSLHQIDEHGSCCMYYRCWRRYMSLHSADVLKNELGQPNQHRTPSNHPVQNTRTWNKQTTENQKTGVGFNLQSGRGSCGLGIMVGDICSCRITLAFARGALAAITTLAIALLLSHNSLPSGSTVCCVCGTPLNQTAGSFSTHEL